MMMPPLAMILWRMRITSLTLANPATALILRWNADDPITHDPLRVRFTIGTHIVDMERT
jgi:hypothetical protein